MLANDPSLPPRKRTIQIHPVIVEILLHISTQVYVWSMLHDIESSLVSILQPFLPTTPWLQYSIISVLVFCVVRTISWSARTRARAASAKRVLRVVHILLLVAAGAVIITLYTLLRSPS